MSSLFSIQVKKFIQMIPRGRVTTYGLLARSAGNRRAARQVVRILHACSSREDLPWHRVVNRGGRIALPRFRGYELQKSLLEAEGIVFLDDERIDFGHYLWMPPDD
ncbi:MAG: MGMT family protein [Desulfohalobiaceae bacterium]|nr:MGMT family protein [Desulfohalobiaceae bacterium]